MFGQCGIGWYVATTAMFSRVTTELAVELAPAIRINAVAPTVVKTRIAGALYEGREDEVAATYRSSASVDWRTSPHWCSSCRPTKRPGTPARPSPSTAGLTLNGGIVDCPAG